MKTREKIDTVNFTQGQVTNDINEAIGIKKLQDTVVKQKVLSLAKILDFSYSSQAQSAGAAKYANCIYLED